MVTGDGWYHNHINFFGDDKCCWSMTTDNWKWSFSRFAISNTMMNETKMKVMTDSVKQWRHWRHSVMRQVCPFGHKSSRFANDPQRIYLAWDLDKAASPPDAYLGPGGNIGTFSVFEGWPHFFGGNYFTYHCTICYDNIQIQRLQLNCQWGGVRVANHPSRAVSYVTAVFLFVSPYLQYTFIQQ